jgi:hypothetical protein
MLAKTGVHRQIFAAFEQHDMILFLHSSAGVLKRCGRIALGSILAGIFIFTAPSLARAAANFSVTVDRNEIAMGESFTLILKCEGGGPESPPAIPAIPNLTFNGPSTSQNQSMIFNGVTTENHIEVDYQYEVTPRQPGLYVIPSFRAVVAGQRFTSEPITLKVTPAVKTKASSGNAFLRLIVPKTEVYVGEVLPVEIQLFFQVAQGGEMPHLNEQGFILGKMLRPNQTTTILNGIRYSVASMKSFVVPVKAGKLDIGPATMNLQVPKSEARDIFGRLVDWHPVTLESDPLTLQVLPLPPANAATGFTGAVGNYSISEIASPTNVAVGDPVTVKIMVMGRGALDSITLPTPTNWQSDFKIYPPTSDFQAGDELGTSGTNTFSLTAVPINTDVKELPPFQFSYFDPQQKTYRTITQPAIPLVVRPSAASLPLPSYSNDSQPASQTNRDIVPIKQHLGPVEKISPPLARQGWFMALQAMPVFALATVFFQRKRREALANNPRLRREIQVRQIIEAGLQELRAQADANQTAEFFATLFRLLQEQIGERLDVPASAITESVIEERLRPQDLPDEQLTSLRELFQACNQARYANQSTNEELVSLIPRLETALADLRNFRA